MPSPAILPDPDELNTADVVIYDGQCRFCRSQVGHLRRLDRRGNRLAFLSLHDARAAQRYPDLSHDELMEQIYVVDQTQRRLGGAEAVKYLSRRLPLLWPLAPILHIPGTSRLWRSIYHFVARNRYRIAGRDCDSDACRVHID